ncbi:MAG: SUMF1/EgtB/PvdO family nonheme iron enzyme [Mariniphaga sp.]
MDKIIDAILKLIPFSKLFELLGLTKETSVGLSVIVSAILIYIIVSQINKLKEHYKNSKIASDLFPYFDYPKVKRLRDFFIPTQFQNHSPSAEEEPGFSHQFVSKSELIPHFLKAVFDEKKEADKFYLILADSGMGKTTFMINLYVAYTSFFNFGRKYKIKLFPFGESRIIKKIEEIAQKQDEAKNTILLLDAFDEYKGLLPPLVPDGLTDDERFRKCLDEISELTRDFREVVITSRTQYFPGQENQAYELKVPRFDEKGFHTLAKLYLSPFSDIEVKQYLNKKYGLFAFWNWKKKQTAEKIVESSPKLMVRPMLLAYIDYLVDNNQIFSTTYQIYNTLIEKWLDREAQKRKNTSTTREKFKKDLYDFSMLVALKMYNQLKETGNLSINKKTAKELCKQNQIDLQDYEITGQSLLTRDIHHNWKFSHKSILEFFLAKKCFEDGGFAIKFEFAGMDMAKKFYEEIILVDFVLIKGGTLKLNSLYSATVNDFYLSKYQVTQEEYVKITGKDNPSKFKANDQNPVEQVSWYETIAYCNLMNAKIGFPKVYDEEGNLLDKDGKTTNDITRVTGFRLPTEAEWEYAAGDASSRLATKHTAWAGTNNESELGGYAWYDKNSEGKTHPVGQKKPNLLGLYDMSGNVWEWCFDRNGEYPKQPQTNPIGPIGPFNCHDRVVRGGSWFNYASNSRVAHRYGQGPCEKYDGIGIRLSFVMPFTSEPGQGE